MKDKKQRLTEQVSTSMTKEMLAGLRRLAYRMSSEEEIVQLAEVIRRACQRLLDEAQEP